MLVVFGLLWFSLIGGLGVCSILCWCVGGFWCRCWSWGFCWFVVSLGVWILFWFVNLWVFLVLVVCGWDCVLCIWCDWVVVLWCFDCGCGCVLLVVLVCCGGVFGCCSRVVCCFVVGCCCFLVWFIVFVVGLGLWIFVFSSLVLCGGILV